MKIYFMSQEYEFAQICSRFVAVYLHLHLKICTLQTRHKKCSVQIDLLFYVFTHKNITYYALIIIKLETAPVRDDVQLHYPPPRFYLRITHTDIKFSEMQEGGKEN